jgi:hypothetical protein
MAHFAPKNRVGIDDVSCHQRQNDHHSPEVTGEGQGEGRHFYYARLYTYLNRTAFQNIPVLDFPVQASVRQDRLNQGDVIFE